jgi:chemotaxis protein CheY-P-specific phosphatase CheC
MQTPPKRELARLAELTHAGAVRAAAAFAQLVNAPITADRPIVHERNVTAAVEVAGRSGDVDSTGVFFEFEGCLDALVGILFPAAGSERLVRCIVGIEAGPLDPTIVESALMEVGNILASHVASGIADALHSRLLPSIPALANGHAEAEFAAWVERVVGIDSAGIEAALCDTAGQAVGRLVIVPFGASGTAIGSATALPSASEPVC